MIRDTNTKVVLTVPKSTLELLKSVHDKYGISKSNVVNTLVLKYVEREYGDLSKVEKTKNKEGKSS